MTDFQTHQTNNLSIVFIAIKNAGVQKNNKVIALFYILNLLMVNDVVS